MAIGLNSAIGVMEKYVAPWHVEIQK